MPTQEEKLNKLQALLKMLDESITRKEFTEFFQNVINQILRVEKTISDKQNQAVADLKVLFNDLKGNTTQYTESEIKTAINTLQARVEKSMKDEENLMNFIRDKVKRIREGKDGKDGKSIVGPAGKDADESKIIKAILDRIEIPDLKDLEEKIKNLETKPNMQIFGGNRPITVQGSGTVKTKTARVINFTGATVSQSTDGVTTVAISAGGANVETPTGDVNGTNTTYTVLNTPKFIVIDGATYYEGFGYSLAGLTITTGIPPVTFIRSHY